MARLCGCFTTHLFACPEYPLLEYEVPAFHYLRLAPDRASHPTYILQTMSRWQQHPLIPSPLLRNTSMGPIPLFGPRQASSPKSTPTNSVTKYLVPPTTLDTPKPSYSESMSPSSVSLQTPVGIIDDSRAFSRCIIISPEPRSSLRRLHSVPNIRVTCRCFTSLALLFCLHTFLSSHPHLQVHTKRIPKWGLCLAPLTSTATRSSGRRTCPVFSTCG